MPASLLAFLLVLALVALWRVVSGKLDADAKALTLRLDRQDVALEAIKERLPAVATKAELGSMGDRFDARLQRMAERIHSCEMALPRARRRKSDE
jgi:hypothetical protein